MTIGDAVTGSVIGALSTFGNYLPQLIAGIIILIIGVIVAAVLREAVLRILNFVKIEGWFARISGGKQPSESAWAKILAELVRWTVVILFLIPAAEAWALPRVTEVLNSLLVYIPNVLVAVVVGFVGFAIANVVFDVVRNTAISLESQSSNLLGHVARYAIIFFTILVVLNQLGIAADLIRILFTGIVVMIALAGGIAFGLGGQDTAKRVYSELTKKFSEK